MTFAEADKLALMGVEHERRSENRPSQDEWNDTLVDAMLAFEALLRRDDFWTNLSSYEPIFMAGYRAGMRRAAQIFSAPKSAEKGRQELSSLPSSFESEVAK